MDKNSARAFLLEMLGAFALVYFTAGTVCVNSMTAPREQVPAVFNPQQPGVLGIAVAQGVIWAVLLALTMPVSGGCLNPAVTIMLWVFNRLTSSRAAWFIGAQLVGALIAGFCLSRTFDAEVLQNARFGTPHLDARVFGTVTRGALITGTVVEFALTFFVVLGMFGLAREVGKERLAAVIGGAMLLAGGVFAFSLTGAAANPARWCGTVVWEIGSRERPFDDMFVYVAGPILGALIGGAVAFKLLPTDVSTAKK